MLATEAQQNTFSLGLSALILSGIPANAIEISGLQHSFISLLARSFSSRLEPFALLFSTHHSLLRSDAENGDPPDLGRFLRRQCSLLARTVAATVHRTPMLGF